MHWIYLTVLLGVFAAMHQVDCSGVFELRLLSYDNAQGMDDSGRCCVASPTSPSICRAQCRTRFRICLKHFQRKIDTSQCTFGDVGTPVLGGNHIDLLNNPQEGFTNPIKFPFDFTWPGNFSLIIEAWHDANESSRADGLITRITAKRWLEIGLNWTRVEQNSLSSVLRYEFRVVCDPHYYGAGCTNFCRPRDDNFGHYSCSSSGDRLCLPGWQGDYCTIPKCLEGCDSQHGHCNKPGECICHTGWTGPFCNECMRYPGCMHGTCVKPWDCLCNEGWGGLFCNQDLNYCTNHKPCRNNGTCFNTGQGSYTCSCPPGFAGTDCEHILTSYNNPPTSCLEDSPCKNGGTCLDNGQCSCPPRYSGVQCEIRLSECALNPCKNGGTCSERTGSGYKCSCIKGFTGDNCETNIDDCKPDACLNGGTCVDLIDNYKCACIPGYVGEFCEQIVNYCITKPCANGGTCHRLTNDYKCVCRTGFTGKDCSEQLNQCASNPCLNGGTCVDVNLDYECRCLGDYRGKNCQEEVIPGGVSARVQSTTSGLTTEHVVVIGTYSTFVPILVLIGAVVVMCLKQRRKREQAKADEEARKQNEQNSMHSSLTKRSLSMTNSIGHEPHIIKNSWGKCTNSTDTVENIDELSYSAKCSTAASSVQVPDYTLQRSRSYKQLNTESTAYSAASILVGKLHDTSVDFEATAPLDKRLSLMSHSSSVCSPSDNLGLKNPTERDGSSTSKCAQVPADKTSVYVIEEHFYRPDTLNARMFATEV